MTEMRRSMGQVLTEQKPKVRNLNPKSGDAGDEVTLAGENLDRVREVLFGGEPAPKPFIRQTKNEIVCLAPDHSSGPADVVAIDRDGNESNALTFIYN